MDIASCRDEKDLDDVTGCFKSTEARKAVAGIFAPTAASFSITNRKQEASIVAVVVDSGLNMAVVIATVVQGGVVSSLWDTKSDG